ncbi:ras association domain-containing protein 1 homolog [Oppia nitens]|uniref:ras association domain-containing protein 1 homolog n=1 Tax=Oppia nitens TaxID=1686743 RepID=UPI0023DBCE44|nr:ras association domain-containing protein 1 homolog [Oppia nitens]
MNASDDKIVANNETNNEAKPMTSTSGSPTSATTSDFKHLSQTIMNSLQWINDFSPTLIFQNFMLSSNPFRRRNSSKQTTDHNINQNKTMSSMQTFDTPVARLLNGTLIPTLKSTELIELANFGIVEIEDKESGVGHDFRLIETLSANWCDSCGEFMWSSVAKNSKTTIVDESNTLSKSIFGKYLRCSHCKYICHPRCRALVRIDCQRINDTNYLFQPLSRSSSPIFSQTLINKINKYNEKRKNMGSGLGITLIDESKQSFRGFLRVHLNLCRPINVIAGRRPPSIYDIINDEDTNGTLIKRRTLTSFYMPRDTVKNLHITSENTSLYVIKAMLKKFKVVDNPQKFALYLQTKDPVTDLTLLKRIGEQEKPLVIQLDCDEDVDEKQIVLQENDTGDIAWDAFELPELNNFIKILDREEKEYLTEIYMRYKLLKDTINTIIVAEEQSIDSKLDV